MQDDHAEPVLSDALICTNCSTLNQDQEFCTECGSPIEFTDDRGHFKGEILLRTKTFLTTDGPRLLLLAIFIGIIGLLIGNDPSDLGMLGGRILVVI